MNTQGKLFKISGLVAIAGTLLPLVLMVALEGVRGGSVSALMTVVVSLLVIAAVSLCVALAAYREHGRKPGSTPLIYAVIAFPLGFVLMFVYFAFRLPPLMMIASLAIVTSIPALIIGIVKKLSFKATSTPVPAETVP